MSLQQIENLQFSQILRNSTFNKIRRMVYERSGISLGDNKQALVRSRIERRMRRLRIISFDDYINFIVNDNTGRELEAMIGVISTNTTEFYREDSHFELMREIIKDWINAGRRKLRVWCAASSTGEEPYTLAMEILETIGHETMDVKILATDMVSTVLKAAIKGEYSAKKASRIPGHLRRRYFIRINTSDRMVYRAKAILRDLLLFRQMNLSVLPYPLKNPLDMVFCRNVMFYFDKSLRVKIVDELRRLIRPGGFLFVGHAESISFFSDKFSRIRPSVYLRK